jgi:hypothetical protein
MIMGFAAGPLVPEKQSLWQGWPNQLRMKVEIKFSKSLIRKKGGLNPAIKNMSLLAIICSSIKKLSKK